MSRHLIAELSISAVSHPGKPKTSRERHQLGTAADSPPIHPPTTISTAPNTLEQYIDKTVNAIIIWRTRHNWGSVRA
ncbi:hypothetical protein QFC22_006257 [Naganishia vaughanmartiniae]|uniref:Uncharacterized protein n=1 Tax=Naganishia vaughanmartiniae TaxID=1424756 RepID=A0ACC2WL96_9TREE|nr:hypothetical protein QFC22_006257 [Naganishia vaughanmartiniae]